MTDGNEPKPTFPRIVLLSVILAAFPTLLLLGSRLIEFGVEKILHDILIYAGLFVFLTVVSMCAFALTVRLNKNKR